MLKSRTDYTAPIVIGNTDFHRLLFLFRLCFCIFGLLLNDLKRDAYGINI